MQLEIDYQINQNFGVLPVHQPQDTMYPTPLYHATIMIGGDPSVTPPR